MQHPPAELVHAGEQAITAPPGPRRRIGGFRFGPGAGQAATREFPTPECCSTSGKSKNRRSFDALPASSGPTLGTGAGVGSTGIGLPPDPVPRRRHRQRMRGVPSGRYRASGPARSEPRCGGREVALPLCRRGRGGSSRTARHTSATRSPERTTSWPPRFAQRGVEVGQAGAEKGHAVGRGESGRIHGAVTDEGAERPRRRSPPPHGTADGRAGTGRRRKEPPRHA
jgi:hypothetical protein